MDLWSGHEPVALQQYEFGNGMSFAPAAMDRMNSGSAWDITPVSPYPNEVDSHFLYSSSSHDTGFSPPQYINNVTRHSALPSSKSVDGGRLPPRNSMSPARRNSSPQHVGSPNHMMKYAVTRSAVRQGLHPRSTALPSLPMPRTSSDPSIAQQRSMRREDSDDEFVHMYQNLVVAAQRVSVGGAGGARAEQNRTSPSRRPVPPVNHLQAQQQQLQQQIKQQQLQLQQLQLQQQLQQQKLQLQHLQQQQQLQLQQQQRRAKSGLRRGIYHQSMDLTNCGINFAEMTEEDLIKQTVRQATVENDAPSRRRPKQPKDKNSIHHDGTSKRVLRKTNPKSPPPDVEHEDEAPNVRRNTFPIMPPGAASGSPRASRLGALGGAGYPAGDPVADIASNGSCNLLNARNNVSMARSLSLEPQGVFPLATADSMDPPHSARQHSSLGSGHRRRVSFSEVVEIVGSQGELEALVEERKLAFVLAQAVAPK